MLDGDETLEKVCRQRGLALAQAVYTALREAEYRSTYPLPYWNIPLLRWLVPRQRRCQEALVIINSTLDSLIAKSKQLVSPTQAVRSALYQGQRTCQGFA